MKKKEPAQKEPAKQELARKAPAKKAPAKKAPAKKARPAADDQPRMARKYSKDRAVCRVTFWLPKDAAPDATSVAVAGSFNDWSLDRHPLKRLKNGDFQLALELEAGREFEFRFVIDGVRWESAWNADKYVWCDHAQCENSVIVT
jgi:hypothetical protein